MGCPIPEGADDYGVRGSSWKPMLWAASVCTLATACISLSLIVLHLQRYRAPQEQRQIVRITLSVLIYSLVALFELYSYEIAQYIDPIGDVYEAFGLCALFLLFVHYAAPKGDYDDDHLAAVKAAEEKETTFDWPRISWVFVFQYPIVELFAVVIQEITEAANRYCVNSLSPAYWHVWYEVIASISIGLCVLCIWQFRNHMKKHMKLKRGLSKLLCFKAIVFIRFAQAWAFSLLLEEDIIGTGDGFSYNDIVWGIPGLCTCVEMILFGLGFWYAFSSTEYGSRAKRAQAPMPMGRAILDVINPTDLIRGIGRIVPLWKELHRNGGWKQWRSAQAQAGVLGVARKGIQKAKAKRAGQQSWTTECDESLRPMAKPADSYRGRNDSAGTQDSSECFPLADCSGQEMYRPPTRSPSDATRTHLVPESPSHDYWNGQRYERSSSPGQSYAGTPWSRGIWCEGMYDFDHLVMHVTESALRLSGTKQVEPWACLQSSGSLLITTILPA